MRLINQKHEKVKMGKGGPLVSRVCPKWEIECFGGLRSGEFWHFFLNPSVNFFWPQCKLGFEIDLWSNFFEKNFFFLPIWIQIGIPKLQRAKSVSKTNENPMKVIWVDSLIFSLSNHARLTRCCCGKFRGKNPQKMAKIEIFEFWFLGQNHKFEWKLALFEWDLGFDQKFFQKNFFFLPIWNQIGIPKLQRAKSASKTNENPMKVIWGDSLIFSLSNHARLTRCCCGKFRGKNPQKMAKIKIFEFWFLGAKSQIWMEIGVFWMRFEIRSKIFWGKTFFFYRSEIRSVFQNFKGQKVSKN